MDADLIERLSEAVHDGWMAEKQAQGYADHVFVPVNSAEQHRRCRVLLPEREPTCWLQPESHHPDMLPYADLAENVREYDRATVRAVLRALGPAGLQIVQATTNEAGQRG